jgi:hypothetical protein
MADTVIDALSLNINANATKAITALTRISDALATMKNGVSGIDNVSGSMKSLTNSLAALSTTELALNNTVKSMNKLSKIDISKATDALASLGKSVGDSLSSFNNIKDTGITQFLNSVNRLSKINDAKQTVGVISEVGNAVKNSFGDMSAIDSNVTKLVAAIARLASAGDKVKIAANGFSGTSGMTQQMRQMIAVMQQMGGVPQSINAFVSSLARLGSLGGTITETANALPQLCNSLMQFMATMQNAPQISENTLRMTEAISQMSNGTNGARVNINNSVGTMSTSLGKLISSLKKMTSSIEGLFKKLVSGIGRVASTIKSHITDITNSVNKTSSVAQGIKTIIGGYLGIQGLRRAFDWTKDAVKSGADLAEINHIVEETFGKDANAIKAWATTAMDQYGIAENEAKHYAGTLSAMFQASGVNRNATAKMATDLVGIAGDLSSFYNIDTAVAYEKVQAAMAGMVRPLRELGIDMSVASLEQYRMSQGIETAYTKMSQADKTILRYQYLMHVTALQQGDFAETSLSAANSMRIFRAYASAITQTIGDGLVSALRYVVWWLDKVMKYLLAAAKAFQSFMHTLFGANISGAGGALLPDVGQMGLEDGAADAGNLSDGLGSAADNAKKLGKNLSVLPFDELNQLQKNDESDNIAKNALGALGDIGGLNMDVGEISGLDSSKYEESINEFARKIKQAFEKHQWYKMGSLVAEEINRGISKLKKYLDPKGDTVKKVYDWCGAVGETLKGFVDTINTYNIGAIFGELITTIANGFNEFYQKFGGSNEFKKVGMKIADGINGIVNYVDWKALGNALGNGLMASWSIFKGFVSRLDWNGVGSALADIINGFFERFSFTEVMTAISSTINGMFNALESFADSLDWDSIGKNIVDGVNGFIDDFDGAGNAKKFNKFAHRFTETFAKVMREIKWEQLGKEIGDFISGVDWGDAFVKLAGSILQALLRTLKGLISTPGGFFVVGLVTAFNGLKLALSMGGLALSIAGAFGGAPFINTVSCGLTASLLKSVGIALPVIGMAIGKGLEDILHNSYEDGGHKVVANFFADKLGIKPSKAEEAAKSFAYVWDSWDGEMNTFVRKYNKNIVAVITGQKSLRDAALDTVSSLRSSQGVLGQFFDSTQRKIRKANEEAKRASDQVYEWKKRLSDSLTSSNVTAIGASTGIQLAFNTMAKSADKSANASAISVEKMSGATEKHTQRSIKAVYDAAKNVEADSGRSKKSFDVLKNGIDSSAGGIVRALSFMRTNANTSMSGVSNSFGNANNRVNSNLSDMQRNVYNRFHANGGIVSRVISAANTLRNAFNFRWHLPDLKLPHISIGRYIRVPVLGTIPDPKTLRVNWYEKGGLFKGGKGQMIGIAENGKDEAVLPLENQRAMARIGKAIAQSGGFNSKEFAETVATSVAQAIIMTQNDRPIVVQSTLKIENDEVLARSVERGKQKLNHRFSY